MKKNKRLGRGLEDISHYFISRNSKEGDLPSSPQDVSAHNEYKSVSIVDISDPQRGASLSSRIGIELSQRGIKVLMIDADSRFPGISFMLGFSLPGFSLDHYFQENYEASDLVNTGPYGVRLVAPHLSLVDHRDHQSEMSLMLEMLASAERESDIVIIRQYEDWINPVLDEAMFVFSASSATLMDSYRAMKRFAAGDDRKRAAVVMADAADDTMASGLFEKISDCAWVSFGFRPSFLGNLAKEGGCAANIVSHLEETALHNRNMTGRKKLFFERFGLLLNREVVTQDERKLLTEKKSSAEQAVPDRELHSY